MSLTLKPGTKLFGEGCATEAIVVKCPKTPVDVRIGGATALTDASKRSAETGVLAGHDRPALMGKRYVDVSGDLELLCIKAGLGAFAIGDTILEVKEAKALPASD
jgi:hypothetical protein